MRGLIIMSDTDDSWWINERIEDKLHSLRSIFDDEPQNHLYDWLQVAHPHVFKQWQSIYDIEREN